MPPGTVSRLIRVGGTHGETGLLPYPHLSSPCKLAFFPAASTGPAGAQEVPCFVTR